ncbi:MAG: hypothetical protein ACYCX4_11720 [Bacillota bacterium]
MSMPDRVVSSYWFKSNRHADEFNKLVGLTQAKHARDTLSALYILASMGKDFTGYVSPGNIEFSLIIIEAEPWHKTERALVSLAAALYNGLEYPADIDKTFYNLDSDCIEVALTAMAIRYRI